MDDEFDDVLKRNLPAEPEPVEVGEGECICGSHDPCDECSQCGHPLCFACAEEYNGLCCDCVDRRAASSHDDSAFDDEWDRCQSVLEQNPNLRRPMNPSEIPAELSDQDMLELAAEGAREDDSIVDDLADDPNG